MSSTTPRTANQPPPTRPAASVQADAPVPPPRLAPGLELIGEFAGSGLKDAPLIARRADGQVIQLHQILYVVADRPLFLPPVVVLVLAGLGVLDYWLFVDHGIAQSVRQVLLDPLLLLMVLGLVVLSAAFHECGHATATRYGGARPGVMGVGIYIVWPAFYTDITDSYRLGKAGRLRADLGGVYFNVIFILATAAAYLVTGFEPLLIMIPLQHVEIVHQFLPFLRLDGYYIISDLTGVPDMFARVKPIMTSLVPGRPTDPRVTELKTWARATVTVWVMILVPVLIGMLGLMAFTAPRMFATAWTSLGSQWDIARHGLDSGSYGRVILAAVQAVALILPAAGLLATFWRLAARIARGYWARTTDAPAARIAGLLVAGAAAIVLVWAWWPRQQYTPIQPNERGTLASALYVVRHAASADPTGGRSAQDETMKHAGVTPVGGGSGRHKATKHHAAKHQNPTPPETSGSSTSTSDGGSTDATTSGSGGETTDTGPQPPSPATDVSADTSAPGQVDLSWSSPTGGDVARTVVRRDNGSACPTSATSGTPIGGTTVRTSQTDPAVSDAATYCYAVFIIDSQGQSSAPATIIVQTLDSSSGGGTSTGP